MRGRKPKLESRGKEFREALMKWQRVPELSRPSLRSLGREIGASHQILAYHLAKLEAERAQARLAARLAEARKRAVSLTREQARAIGRRVAAYRASAAAMRRQPGE